MTAPKPQRRSIRFAIVAVVCLLLGAVTTVGVAWWLGRPTRIAAAALPGPSYAWFAESNQRGLSDFWSTWEESAAIGLRRTLTYHGWNEGVQTTEAGWPMLAVCTVCDMRGGLRPGDWPQWPRDAQAWREGWERPSWLGGGSYFDDCLPILPLFPGFALDTAVYAAAWYLLIFALPLMRAGRRRFRVSRGMCGSCGYDLKGSKGGACPECGDR